MTNDKRFTLREPDIDDGIGCEEIADNGQWITYGEIVDLLNQQNDDNEQLKQQVDFYKDFQKDARELEKENEQLKQGVKCREERIAILVQLLDLADTIIDLGDDESAKEFWEKMNDNMDSKWGELIKKAKRDYTSGGIYDD